MPPIKLANLTRQNRLPLCRPAGWVALWRQIGTASVLNRKARAFS